MKTIEKDVFSAIGRVDSESMVLNDSDEQLLKRFLHVEVSVSRICGLMGLLVPLPALHNELESYIYDNSRDVRARATILYCGILDEVPFCAPKVISERGAIEQPAFAMAYLKAFATNLRLGRPLHQVFTTIRKEDVINYRPNWRYLPPWWPKSTAKLQQLLRVWNSAFILPFNK